MPDNGVRTTETSSSEGRLKVGAGCSHGKKKCLKCAIKKKDGMGGPGYKAPGYGASLSQASINTKLPKLSYGSKKKSFKLKKIKSFSSGSKRKSGSSTKRVLLKGLLRKAKK